MHRLQTLSHSPKQGARAQQPMDTGKPRKLAVVVTHPIQYYAPLFKQLGARQDCQLKVFYTWGVDSVKKFDPDFGKEIEWDVPLLTGYDYEFLLNTSARPGSHHFRGISNPGAIKSIDRYGPDAILVYGWAYRSHLQLLRHYKGKVPLWFRGDSTLLDAGNGIKNFARRRFLSWVYRYTDLAFYVGTHNKAYYKTFGLKESQLVFAPHAVDNRRFSEGSREDAVALRRKLNIPVDALLVLFAGKLEPKKDPVTLLQAFLRLAHPDAYLLYAGNGVLEPELKSIAAGSDLLGRVKFTDFQNQAAMPALYKACDLFCLPSVGPGETWGLAVNEAMAAARPVLVSSKTGCSIDLVEPGVNGAIFRSGDTADLVQKLSALLRDPVLLKKMREASAALIENWSVDAQVNAILYQLKTIRPRT